MSISEIFNLLGQIAGLVVAGFILVVGLSVLAALFQILTANETRISTLASRAGGLTNLWLGSMPVRNHGDRRFECTAGITVDERTGLIRESARVSNEIIDETFQ